MVTKLRSNRCPTRGATP